MVWAEDELRRKQRTGMRIMLYGVLACLAVAVGALVAVNKAAEDASSTVTHATAGISECGFHFYVVTFGDGSVRIFTPPEPIPQPILDAIDALPQVNRTGIRVNCASAPLQQQQRTITYDHRETNGGEYDSSRAPRDYRTAA